MAKYVISDIHGCFREFIALLKEVNFSEKDTLYVLGDVVDRGPEPIKCLKYIIERENIKMLKGNHEDFMIKSIINGSKRVNALWMFNGGEITLTQYEKLSGKEQREINQYLDCLPLYFIIDDYILVHAGINSFIVNPKLSVEDNMRRQAEDDLLWIRENFINNPNGFNEKIIIFGHTPTSCLNPGGEDFVWVDSVYQDKIDIDCGCVYGGNLSLLNLDTLEIIYTKKIPQK